jgi:hypothetical protein
MERKRRVGFLFTALFSGIKPHRNIIAKNKISMTAFRYLYQFSESQGKTNFYIEQFW